MFKGFERFEVKTPLDVTSTRQEFPVIENKTTAIVKSPEAIFVQSLSTNTQNIVIGDSTVEADATVGAMAIIEPGGNAILPVRDITKLYAISSSGSNLLLVTYLEGNS